MKHKYYLVGCMDCLHYVATGFIPEDRPDLPSQIEAHLGERDARHLVVADEENSNCWFSWSNCDVCGAKLAGMRMRFAVLEPE